MVPLEGYQDEIYLNGLGGAVPPLPADLNRLEELARAQMPPQAFGYIYGGAGSGTPCAKTRLRSAGGGSCRRC